MRVSLLLVSLVAGTAFIVGRISETPAASATTSRVLVAVPGDVIRIPSTGVRCEVSGEGGAPDLLCAHAPSWRYQVVFYRDNLFVFRNGYPDDPAFSAHGHP